MLVERPAPLSALPAGPTFRLVHEPCPAPATYEGCVTLRALPVDPSGADPDWDNFEAASDAEDALCAAYRAAGRPVGFGYLTEGRGVARCHVTYVGAYRIWQPLPELAPWRGEVCQ